MRVLFLEKKRIDYCIYLAFLVFLCILLTLPANAVATTSDAITNLRQQQQQINQQHQSVKQERDRLTNLQQAAQERLNGVSWVRMIDNKSS
ncbi:peptidase M23B [Fischerella sp. NIES-4106]|nr:peptidase M23B [Fischerella sp. NIES-4106]